ncbi:acyl carrier protein [Lacrimispora algidixylanolytica]|uniref:D-alanyl carrier protein n=1 Tax=Lacrimispora algidixylanolytica TaxID=94868 RepID=A0A419T197_9FIRM|nr:acyl carrier protein [Lacrimispora algidixylanolytica]RKD31350.1 D-alanyl carrier protein [Lacrimispora algidixylanolytica]
MQIKEKVREFLSRFLRNYNVADDENLFDNKLVNSLFAMQLIVFIEREFEIALTNDDFQLENFQTINSIATLIELKKGSVLGEINNGGQ